MATKYYALLTNVGAAKLANATALGEQVEITQMAVGDGNGALPTPNPAHTALVHELRRAPLNTLTIDPVNTNQIIAEQVIPEDVGGWWIREIGLYDSDGDMIAVANCAETYKPFLQEGSGRVQVIRVILIVSSTQTVNLKIDPSVVLATRQYVDDKAIEVKGYADDLMAEHLAEADPHKQYPLIANALKEMADAGLVSEVLKNLGLGNIQGRLLNVQVFTKSGTYKPTDGTKNILVEMVGGGGPGGDLSVLSENTIAIASGGAAGGYIRGLLRDFHGETQVIVGAAQGTSTFGDPNAPLLTAAGGRAGSIFSGTSPAAGMFSASTLGATASSGDVSVVLSNVTGMDGGYAFAITDTCLIPGDGGSTPLGKGGAFHGSLNEPGVDGQGYGSGGSGSGKTADNPTGQPGGQGMPGIVIIYEFS